MRHRRPEVFVSATSADLRSCRQLVKEGLLTLGCVPVEQTNFPPDYRRVRDVLRSKIAGCDAVIHLAGECYGAEPARRDGVGPRRSYTQLEYDLARELHKPLYVFLCDPAFAFDGHSPEDAEKHRLQQAHRAALSAGDNLRCEVGSRADLALRVRELQTSVERLTEELKKTRSWLGRGIAVGIALLVLLGGGLYWLNQRTAKTEKRVASLETEFDRQRRYAVEVVEAYRQQQAEFDRLNLTEGERLDRVLLTVAKREKQPEAAVWSAVTSFIAAVRANQKASAMDSALADIAHRNVLGGSADARMGASRNLPPQNEVRAGLPIVREPIPVAKIDATPTVSTPRAVSAVSAPDDLAALRAQMQKRVSAIAALKDRLVVGEDNRGYLDGRGDLSGNETRLISEENVDRQAVYAALALQTRVTAEMVGRKRAEQLVGLAKRGHWIQDSSGAWRQKP